MESSDKPAVPRPLSLGPGQGCPNLEGIRLGAAVIISNEPSQLRPVSFAHIHLLPLEMESSRSGGRANDEGKGEIVAEAILLEDELWQEFNQYQNEMIITKMGRCLFPLLRIRFLVPPLAKAWSQSVRLNNDGEYRVLVGMRPVDHLKWKWRDGKWIPLLTAHKASVREAAAKQKPNQYAPFVGPVKGGHLLQTGINLDRLKLTNRPGNPSDHSICLHSFYRYLPTISIISMDGSEETQEICFPQTEFIAVTHYQNDAITLLKKSYNPHAKGFVLTTPEGKVRREGERAVDWQLPSIGSSTPSNVIDEPRSGRRTRKRVLPVDRPPRRLSFESSPPAALVPSDDEELAGGIALQSLGNPPSSLSAKEEL